MAADMEEGSGGRGNGFLTLRQDCRSCMSALCCSCIGNTEGTLCFRPGKTNIWIRCIWAFIFLVSFFMTIVFLTLVFGNQTINPSPTDMRIIDDHISSIFCSRFSVYSESRLSVYELSRYPVIADHNTATYETSIDTLVTASEYIHRNFYMLKGSRICITSHSTGDLNVLIITGHSRWMLFTQGEEYADSSVYSRLNEHQRNDSFEYTVGTSDDIFIVYFAINNCWIKSSITLNRKLYDVTRTIYTCADSTTCDFELQFGRPTDIVYLISDVPYNETQAIETYCQPRTQFYLLIFLFCPILICLSATCLMYYLRRERESSNTDDENSRLLCLETSTSYMFSQQQAIVQRPPKYEDLEREGFIETPPPSYDDVFDQSACRQNRMDEIDLRS